MHNCFFEYPTILYSSTLPFHTYGYGDYITMAYIPYKLNLKVKQKQQLSTAYKAKSAVTLRLAYEQLQSGDDTLGLTQTQINRLEKRKVEKKGIQLTLSPTQLAKQGGFLGPLLLNVAKTVLPKIGISALEGATSALIQKAVTGSGCNCQVYAKKAAPHLIKKLPLEQQKRALAELKEGGFILPLITAAASSLIPTVIDLIRGKGYQVKPPRGSGYQVRPPPKNVLTTL